MERHNDDQGQIGELPYNKVNLVGCSYTCEGKSYMFPKHSKINSRILNWEKPYKGLICLKYNSPTQGTWKDGSKFPVGPNHTNRKSV